LSFSLDWQHLSAGLAVALLVAYGLGGMFTNKAPQWLDPQRYYWFMVYIVVFVWECIKANIDVAQRVLKPHLPIRPGIVRVKTALKSETALTFLANFITLTPGTFCLDIDRHNGYIYIHWIYVETEDPQEAAKIISARFENILKRVFE
jgi:multicomponent Na+:H+ antiporter subunit E